MEYFRYDGHHLTCLDCGGRTRRVAALKHEPGCRAVNGVKGLTRTEKVVAHLLSVGVGMKEIAQRFGCATKTIETHKFNIYKKLGVHGIAEMTRMVVAVEQEMERVMKGEQVKTRLAQLIGRIEGWGKPGAIPTVDNNPGDLRHSPHSQHAPGDPNAIGKIDTVAHGWEDLERQLQIYADRGMTLSQMVELYAPEGDNNDPQAYLQFLMIGLGNGVGQDTPVSDVLNIPAEITA